MSKKRIRKIKPGRFEATPIQALIILSPLLILLIFILSATFLFLFLREPENMMPRTLTSKNYNHGTEYPIEKWKTYTNNKYGFSIKYPAVGYIQDPECMKSGVCRGKVILGMCGNGIKVEPWTKSSSFIQLDNMLGVIVNDYYGTIREFLKSQGANPANYKIVNQNISGAKEAVYVEQKKDSDETAPIPVISSPTYLIKHGQYIFQLASLQNFGSEKGCLPPAGTNANTFKSSWNIPESITFN